MVQMMAVLALPPKEDCNIRVNFESLKGICPFLPLLHPKRSSICQQEPKYKRNVEGDNSKTMFKILFDPPYLLHVLFSSLYF